MMIKTKDGLDVVGVSSAHLGHDLPCVSAGDTVEARFQIQLNLAPGTYFLNSGVSCVRNQEEVLLHRRVDLAAIRVIGDGQRDFYGLAYVDPHVECVRVQGEDSIHG
jgi:lipopolysaccharide transport system ATP-binding protein